MLSSVVKIHTQHVIYDPYMPFQIMENPSSTGTAFFIDNEHLLTCFHCVEYQIKSYISDPNISKKQYLVEVIAAIPKLDIAILRLCEPLEHAILEMGDSSIVKQLDQVVALGYPLDSDSLKYTKGIISGKQNELIQTDATLNPGNSGGPLLFEKKVIGINSSKFTNAENTGFSVPINFYKKWLPYIQTQEKPVIIRLPRLNLVYSKLNDFAIEFFNKKMKEPIKSGVLVTKSNNKLFQDTDIITLMNDTEVDNFGNIKLNENKILLSKYINNFIINQTVIFTVIRENNKIVIPFELKKELPLGTDNVYFPFERYNYIVIGGIVIMELTKNHLITLKNNNIQSNLKLKIKEAIDDKLNKTYFVSKVLSGSKVKSLENVYSGNIIKNINGIKIKSFNDITIALKLKKEQLIIYFESDTVFIYPYKELLKIDQELQKVYKYDITY